jgi:hypothetical protein
VLDERVPDQHGRIDSGRQHVRVEDAGHMQPRTAVPVSAGAGDQDALTGEQLVDTEQLGGFGAEHADWLALRGDVDEVARGEAGAGGQGWMRRQ